MMTQAQVEEQLQEEEEQMLYDDLRARNILLVRQVLNGALKRVPTSAILEAIAQEFDANVDDEDTICDIAVLRNVAVALHQNGD